MAYGFKYLPITADGGPRDPAAAFVTAVPNWRVGEEFMLSDGSRFRILGISTDMTDDELDELYQRGFNGIWMVEPAE